MYRFRLSMTYRRDGDSGPWITGEVVDYTVARNCFFSAIQTRWTSPNIIANFHWVPEDSRNNENARVYQYGVDITYYLVERLP